MEKKAYVMDIGSSETVACSLQNETEYIKWYDGVDRELKSTPEKKIEVSGGTLIINNIQLSDGGTYQCRGLTYTRLYTIYVNGRVQ